MSPKTKILIGILVIGIILIGGWWIWNPQIYAGAQEVTITTNKTEYGREEKISLTVLNNLNRYIIVSACPTGEGFVTIEKKDKLDKWQEMPIAIMVDTICRGPLTLRSRESHTYPDLMNTREIRLPELPVFNETTGKWIIYDSKTGELIETEHEPTVKKLGDVGIYRIKFGYLFSLPYSQENTYWVYSNEFTIKEKVTQEVTVTTDKTEYKQVETIKITLKNNLKESIFSHIGSGTPIFCIEYIERKTTKGNWERLLAQGQYPYVFSEKPRDIPKEIKLGQSEIFEWKPLIYINGTSESIQASSGIYRLVILYQIRKGLSSENWEWKTVRSNEFKIK